MPSGHGANAGGADGRRFAGSRVIDMLIGDPLPEIC
jgi:hypothetical protein